MIYNRYSTHNERKYLVAERFIRTLMNKIYKYMNSTSINVYIDKLHDIVNKCNNTYHSTIKTELVDVKSSTYFVFNKENNKEYLKFELGGHLGISKYKSIFAKGYPPNWSEKVSMIPWRYIIGDINSEEPFQRFYKKSCKKQIKKNLELKS